MRSVRFTGPTGPERTDMSEENQRIMDMLSDPLRNPMMSGRVENTFGPLDYVLGAFPAHRFIKPAAQKVVKMLGLDDLSLPSLGFGKLRPGPSEAAVAGAEPVVQRADQILTKEILDALFERQFLKQRPNIEKLPPPELFDDVVRLTDDHLGGQAWWKSIKDGQEKLRPEFYDYVMGMRHEVIKKLTEKLGRTPFQGKYKKRDIFIADEMLDDMLEPFFRKSVNRPPGNTTEVLTDRMLNPDNPYYAPYKLNANGGRIAVDPTGPAELTFPQEMFIRGMHMESGFDPKVVSPAGAQGIAQIMPNTVTEFRRLGIIGENEPFDPFDINDARKGQEGYMNYLITRNEGTDQVRLAKAVAAYNYGQKNLNRYLAKQVDKGVDTMNTLDWVDELPKETKDYVNALMFAEFPERKKDYEKQRHRYFETYPDVQDEREATPREDVAPMESKDPSPQISPELQNALDILVRDQKKYEHGGRHDDDPPAYSKGKQLLDYLDSYGVPGGRGDANNRFEATLQDVADFYLGRQGTSLGTEPQKQYDRSVRDFVTVPSESELFPVILDETFVTDDPKEKRRYADLLREDQFDDKGGYRSSVSNIQYDPVTERYISEIERQDLKRNDDQEILDRLVNRALVYNYPSSNPSGRPNVEEFYHAVQRTADRARGRFGGFDGNSEDVSELVDMARHTVGGALMFDDTHPVDQLVNLYYANEPLGFGDKHYYEGTSKDHSAGPYSRFNTARYYFGKGNKMEADAALQSAVYEAKKMGILPEGPITEEDLPGVLERLQGYTASQPGRVEFDPEKLKNWKPDGRKIAKVGKDGEITMTKYGQKWMQDDENKLRFRERTMTQGEGREARLDTEYTRILETLIYDAVNKRNIFNPSIGSLENIREEYDRRKSELDKDDYRRTDPERPYNQPGSGKTPTELLLNIINTGGGEYPSYRVLSDRSEEYLKSRSE